MIFCQGKSANLLLMCRGYYGNDGCYGYRGCYDFLAITAATILSVVVDCGFNVKSVTGVSFVTELLYRMRPE